MVVLENKDFEKDIQELITKYDFNSEVNIRIFLGVEKNSHLIRSNNNCKENELIIKFDPNNQLNRGHYEDCYYCNTLKELKELVVYFIQNSNLYQEYNSQSEDILDQKDTLKTDIYSLEEYE